MKNRKQIDGIDNMSLFQIPKDVRSTDKIYIQDGILYKIFGDNSFIREKKRNIDYLIHNKVPNSPEIYIKINKGNEICGYAMEYIPNAMTFRQAIGNNLPLNTKIKAIEDVYEALKHLHTNSIYLGDIHSDNMLITETGGYLIDLEEIRFPGDEWKYKQYYLVKPNSNSKRINIPSDYTDNIKLMICSLSLLLDRDLELLIDQKRHEINVERLYNEIVKPLNNEEINDYFEGLMDKSFKEYFSDIMKKIYNRNKERGKLYEK